MPAHSVVDTLNRAMRTIYRSLAMFVGEVHPYTQAGDERTEVALANLVADQKQYSNRLADLVMDLGGMPQAGSYPMLYTDLHLLSLDYLMNQIIEYHQRDVLTLQECAAQVAHHDRARALLEEVLGNARGHLQSLKELSAPVVA